MPNESESEIEIAAAFEYYRAKGFPYPDLAPHDLWYEFHRTQKLDLKISAPQMALFEDMQARELEIRHEGIAIANAFHPHIWESHAYKMISPVAAYEDDKKLYHAIELAKQTNGRITDTAVRNKLKIVHGAQMCSNFRPLAAKAVYQKLATGNRILDPSAGYGGRLLGWLLSNVDGEYHGVDPSHRTCEGNRRMASFFGRGQDVRMIEKPMEDTNDDDLPGLYDFAFTSPPYFRKEIYDDAPTQSAARYKDYAVWLERFWAVVLEKAYRKVATAGCFVVNAQDVKLQGRTYPLADDTVACAEAAGWHLEETLYMRFSGFGKGLDKFKREPLFVFRKP